MGRNQLMLSVTEEQRNELDKWAGSRPLPAGDVFRARLILALADGQTYNQIMTSLQTSAPTVARWKQRFEEEGLAGPDPGPQGGRLRVGGWTDLQPDHDLAANQCADGCTMEAEV